MVINVLIFNTKKGIVIPVNHIQLILFTLGFLLSTVYYNGKNRGLFPIADLMAQVESFLRPRQFGALVHCLCPIHSTFNVDNVKLGRRLSGGVFSQKTIQSNPLHVLPGRAEIKDTHVEAASLLRLRDNRRQGVGEVFEQPILQIDWHTENTIQELGHVVVVFVQREQAGCALAVADQTNADQCVGHILEEVTVIILRRWYKRRFVPSISFVQENK